MSVSATNILAGAGTFSIGAYTSAGGSGSLTDVGHVAVPYALGASFENFDVETERSTGIVKTVPIRDGFTLKVTMHEATCENMRVLLGQPSANLTGTSPNFTLRVGDRAEQYHQATLAVAGLGSNDVQTLTFWKLQIASIAEIQYGKGVTQLYEATFRVLRDDTVATADKYFKRVDS